MEMEKEMLNDNDLEEISGGGVTLILNEKECTALQRAGFLHGGKINPDDIEDIREFLRLLGKTDPLHIIYY